MDITASLAPKSDRLDAIELVAPRTFTIESVSETDPSKSDQPYSVHLVGFPRAWRPGVTMRRVIATAWTEHTEKWIGQQVTLYNDISVKFGNETTGGVRISHMSGIDKPVKVPILIGRKSALYTVQPLETPAQPVQSVSTGIDDATVAEWAETFAAASTLEALSAAWQEAAKNHVTLDSRVVAAKDARKRELS